MIVPTRLIRPSINQSNDDLDQCLNLQRTCKYKWIRVQGSKSSPELRSNFQIKMQLMYNCNCDKLNSNLVIKHTSKNTANKWGRRSEEH